MLARFILTAHNGMVNLAGISRIYITQIPCSSQNPIPTASWLVAAQPIDGLGFTIREFPYPEGNEAEAEAAKGQVEGCYDWVANQLKDTAVHLIEP